MFKEWLKKIKKDYDKTDKEESKTSVAYSNRFVKFYHLNKDKLNKQRKGSYSERKKSGICVRCKRKALPGIVFCDYHQSKQKEYNQKARGEK